MTDIIFIFKVHQPFRVKPNIFWKGEAFRKISLDNLLDFYFDNELNRQVFERACNKCYFPATQILLSLIDEFKKKERKVKLAFSLSGTFLDQCEKWNKDLLELFKQLKETNLVEFLAQTYYHSLASLYEDKREFIEQVLLQYQAMKDLFNYEPKVFENCELIFNNEIARIVERLSFNGIITEGSQRILMEKSPNYVYKVRDCKRIKVLLRNYRLSDDIAFRFSLREWNEWPLTANKYASWLSATPGNIIVIFIDYETFGEHHWPESGILEFLRYLPKEILKWEHLSFSTPTEAIEKYNPIEELDVPSTFSSTISWSGIERNLSSWLENPIQLAYFIHLQRIEPFIRESENPIFLKAWRYLQTSDHLHSMYTKWGPTSIVHTYFSPYDTPFHAYIACQTLLTNLEIKVREYTLSANEPFLFYEGIDQFINVKAYSLRGFLKAIKNVSLKSLYFHLKQKDFEKWFLFSFNDKKLANEFRKLRILNITGELLRTRMLRIITERLIELRASSF